jgi:hypothetical protein
MSTPSEKVPHLVDLAAHVARQARPAKPDQPVERHGDGSPPRSPYAPKPAHERAAARLRVLAKDDADAVLSAYAPKRVRPSESAAVTNSYTPLPSAPQTLSEPATAALPQDASGHARIDDAPRLAPEQASGSSPDRAGTPDNRSPPVNQSRTASEQASGKHLRNPAQVGSRQPPAAADNERRQQPSGEFKRRVIADRELDRFEDILRQLQRREPAATRLPRGANLPPPQPIPAAPDAPGDILGRRAKLLDNFGRLRSLEPTQLPPPPPKPMPDLRVILGISTACVGAAIACYYFLSAPSSSPTLTSQVASLPPASPAGISTPERPIPLKRGPRLDSEPEWAPRTSDAHSDLAEVNKLPERDNAAQTMASSQRPANARLESAGEQAATRSSSKAVRTLPPEEIRLLLEQGQRFLADGDIVTARVIFERAAKAGDAAAALALAAAYDPIVLARLGVLGIDTDVEKARVWYQKAQSLGSEQAVERLDALARR